MFIPSYKQGDIAFEGDIPLPEGYSCYVVVSHGNPMTLHKGLRRLTQLTGCIWDYEGYTADQIEADLAMLQDTAATE